MAALNIRRHAEGFWEERVAEQEIPGLGMLDLEQMRADLVAWRAHADEALERRDWKAAFLRYPRLDLRQAPPPWALPPEDVGAARITLIGSAGLSADDQRPFDAVSVDGDFTFRMLPTDLDLATTAVDHDHYDNAAALQDRNVVYPLDRLRELAAAGEIGGLTGWHLAFMGYQPDYVTLIERFIPALMDAVMAQRPDAALLVPV